VRGFNEGMEPIIATFASIDDASAARASLIAQGVAAEHIELRVSTDEAGPVEGNFLIGNGRTERHDDSPRGVLAGPEVPYDENFRNPVFRGSCLLIITAPSLPAGARALVEQLRTPATP